MSLAQRLKPIVPSATCGTIEQAAGKVALQAEGALSG